MNLTRFAALGAILLMLGIALTACGQANPPAGSSVSAESASSQTQPSSNDGAQVVNGVINRKGDFLVLLTEDGAYQVMELGEDISLDGFSEGDSVKVTYTGTLGDEENTPVVTAIELSE